LCVDFAKAHIARILEAIGAYEERERQERIASRERRRFKACPIVNGGAT
jgi:hypothetical protein